MKFNFFLKKKLTCSLLLLNVKLCFVLNHCELKHDTSQSVDFDFHTFTHLSIYRTSSLIRKKKVTELLN